MILLSDFEKRLNDKGIDLLGNHVVINECKQLILEHHDSGLRLWLKRANGFQDRLTKKRWMVTKVSPGKGTALVESDGFVLHLVIVPGGV
jgi:hypothetical protein